MKKIIAIGIVVMIVVSGFLVLRTLEKSVDRKIEDCFEKYVVGCGGDSECMARANYFCGHLLPSDCWFAQMGYPVCD